jgi:UDP-glucose 4-epimerase
MIAKINSILGYEIEPIFDAPKVGEIKHSMADITKAGKLLGYCPEVDFEDGLKRVILWMKG